MYGTEQEESRVYRCPRCEKGMGNSPETIKRHNKKCKPTKKKPTNANKSLPKSGKK